MHLLDISSSRLTAGPIPDYLRDVYTWAYLTPWLTGFLDRQVVVQAILWGNAQRLIDDVLAAVKPGTVSFSRRRSMAASPVNLPSGSGGMAVSTSAILRRCRSR
jgi:hypothetical protein